MRETPYLGPFDLYVKGEARGAFYRSERSSRAVGMCEIANVMSDTTSRLLRHATNVSNFSDLPIDIRVVLAGAYLNVFSVIALQQSDYRGNGEH